MTKEQKDYIVACFARMLDEIPENGDVSKMETNQKEMLTVTECSQTIKGLRPHTVRLMIKRGDLPSFRTGEGRSGKLLVPKDALIEYFNNL